MAGNRDIRKLINTKQDVTEFNGTPSVGGMSDGQIAITKSNNKQLALYRKKYGKLWKSYMSYDGNQYVEKNLTVKNDITIHGFPYLRNFPAFSVYQSAAQDEQAVATVEFTRITFDSELYDIGGNFASNVFTAPVNGIYTFSAKLLWDKNADSDAGDWDVGERHDISLFKNESSATLSGFTNRVASELKITPALTAKVVMNSITVDLKLDKGDYIGAYAYQNSGVEQHTYSTNSDDWTQFSGRLVTAI